VDPAEALVDFHARHGAFRVLVCGGDGSASWVLGAIESCALTSWDGQQYRPAVAILPLGTGNDLARVLGWGKSVRLDRVTDRLDALEIARPSMLDRWAITGSLPEGRAPLIMMNYLSVGIDAKAALLWTRLSRAMPQLFRLRLLNKLWYIVCGAPELLLHTYANLHERVELVCDGKPIEIPPSVEGLMVLNIPSYGGGSDLWDESRGAPLTARSRHFQTGPPHEASMADGTVEVVGVTDVLHLACSLGGLSNGVRLCQGAKLSIRARDRGVALQVDGEPFNTDASTSHSASSASSGRLRSWTCAASEPFDVRIERAGQAFLLARGAKRMGGGVRHVSALSAIEHQLRSKAISTAQRDALLRKLGRG